MVTFSAQNLEFSDGFILQQMDQISSNCYHCKDQTVIYMDSSKKEKKNVDCTEVLLVKDIHSKDDLDLRPRTCLPIRPTQRVMEQKMDYTEDQILEIIKGQLELERELKPARLIQVRRDAVEWKDKVNSTRTRIITALNSSQTSNIRSIARYACCDVSTVRSVITQLQIRGQLQDFQYRSGHSQETVDQLNDVLDDPDNRYFSIGDYKRLLPQCSRKYIARTLKRKGRKYLKAKRQRQVPSRPIPLFEELKSVIWPSIQGFCSDNVLMMYLDEAEFPLRNSADYCWAKDQERPLYNRRDEVQQALHVIALCTKEGYFAFQICKDHPNQHVILYFLRRLFSQLPHEQRVLILLDNAGWHVSRLVQDSEVGQYLFFNAPRMYELNLIENSFAKAKAMWRQRPVAIELKEEVKFLVELFKNRQTREDFAGYRRQYLRNLRSFISFQE